MLANIFKPIILWMFGGVVAAGFAGYAIVDSYNATRSAPEISEVVAEKEMPKTEKPVEVASLPKKPIETKPEAMPKPAVASAPEPAPEHPLPKFDILRVEQDGYAVIAGSAPAGSKVEILDGNTVIATEKAGSTNEFVVILDKPLAPGPHDLIIRATLDGGKKLVSAEAGIVNIPDGKNELLAMVTEPGKASRFLQLPEPKQETKKQASKEMQKEVVAETPKEAPKVEKEPAVEMAKKPEQETAPAPVEVEEAKKEEPQIASLEQQPKEQAAVEEKPMATPAISEQPEPTVKIEEPKQITKVKESAEPQVPVLIQAAEVEGEKIFIAGTGMSGTSVHIYIDGKFLGKTLVGSEGSYVFEGVGGLDAGRHAVRADMVSKNGTDVIARAVVSLLHEPVAIDPVKVAKVKPAPKTVEPAKDMAKMAEEKLPESKLEAMPKPAGKKEMAAISPKPESAKMSPSADQPAQEPMKVAAVEEKIEMSSNAEIAAAPKKIEITKPVTQMEKTVVETDSNTTANVAEITTGSSVIIRKGDSLWRVSQRRYGQGVRYTTIFDANRDQIRDPDLIYPGQVFEIPEFKEKS